MNFSFQFPAIYSNKITLVISPLRVLMEEEGREDTTNRPSIFMHSAQSENVMRDVYALKYSMVYVSPVYMLESTGIKLLKELKYHIGLIAVDHAQCVSQWGKDFNKDYKKLRYLKHFLSSVPIIAVTGKPLNFYKIILIQIQYYLKEQQLKPR